MEDKKIVYVDMDDVLADFLGSYKRAIAKLPEMKYPQAGYDFFRKLEPVPGMGRRSPGP